MVKLDLNRCYRTLGIQPTASADQVHRAYRNLVKTWHPDRFVASPLLKTQAEEALKQINAAYTQLSTRRPFGAKSAFRCCADALWPLIIIAGRRFWNAAGQALARCRAQKTRARPHLLFGQGFISLNQRAPNKTFQQVLKEVRDAGIRLMPAVGESGRFQIGSRSVVFSTDRRRPNTREAGRSGCRGVPSFPEPRRSAPRNKQ